VLRRAERRGNDAPRVLAAPWISSHDVAPPPSPGRGETRIEGGWAPREGQAVRCRAGRLDPGEDFELWFWMTLSAGTNALNAALHRVGATDDGEYFCTQAVDVYLGLDEASGTWKPAIRFGCDIIHVGCRRSTSRCRRHWKARAARWRCSRGARSVRAGRRRGHRGVIAGAFSDHTTCRFFGVVL